MITDDGAERADADVDAGVAGDVEEDADYDEDDVPPPLQVVKTKMMVMLR